MATVAQQKRVSSNLKAIALTKRFRHATAFQRDRATQSVSKAADPYPRCGRNGWVSRERKSVRRRTAVEGRNSHEP